MRLTDKISNKKHILQFIPKNLSFLNETKILFFNEKKLKTAYIIDIIHKMMCRKYFSNKTEINLSSKILREWYGTYYNYYIDYLVKHDIIILISNYRVSLKCATYMLNSDCFSGNIKDVIRIQNNDKIIVKKWIKAHVESDIDMMNSNVLSKTIKNKLIKDLYHVEIDFKRSTEYLKNIYDNNEIDIDSYWKNQLSIEAIEDGSIFHVEDDYGRLHTNFTVLKRAIRKEFITIDGNNCAELDIACSQPVFLIGVLKKLDFHITHREAFDKYYNIVKSGKIYDKISEYYPKSKRDDVKKGVYKVLFGKQSLKFKENKIFYKLFPEIFMFIKDYKKDNHKILAHELQRLESDLIFNHICYRLKKEIPNMRLITIHDSIFFPEQYLEKTSEIFYNFVDTLF